MTLSQMKNRIATFPPVMVGTVEWDVLEICVCWKWWVIVDGLLFVFLLEVLRIRFGVFVAKCPVCIFSWIVNIKFLQNTDMKRKMFYRKK